VCSTEQSRLLKISSSVTAWCRMEKRGDKQQERPYFLLFPQKESGETTTNTYVSVQVCHRADALKGINGEKLHMMVLRHPVRHLVQ
jgi:hypothetical protein